MRISTFSVLGSFLVTSTWATPIMTRAGPSGTLVTPNDGTQWYTDGTGRGHVVYQGVNQNYNNPPITHVMTYAVDVSLVSEDGTTTYQLATGLAPDSKYVVDEQFLIPSGVPYATSQWRVVIEETQLANVTTQNYPEQIVSKAAAPLITINAFKPL